MNVGEVVETATGQIISFEELIPKLMGASFVYVGEVHTSSEDHQTQLSVLRKLSATGQCIELGMEMFPRTAQPVLDRYVKGGLTEEEFLQEVRWDQVWGFPYQLYRPLIDFARQKGIRIIGLNAPHNVVRKIARNGLSSLSAAEREEVARDFHLDDPKNRNRIFEEYKAHGKGEIKDFESFFEAQLAWEETMAETLAASMKEQGDRCKIVVILGKGHISGRLGVPYLTAMRLPREYKTIAPVPINYPFSTFDPDLADYVVITDKPEPVHRPRLGISVQTAASGRGAEILGVIPEMPGAKADLRKGDILLTIDGSAVNSAEEVQQALAQGGPDYTIVIQRGKKKMTINVKIGKPKQ